jgi:acetyltransferase-like isoleucine patch superfamily enzyme|tara:strand:+ start:245 stop:649 length:405 start_codon:yes stop_codon:yes gene_type:complete
MIASESIGSGTNIGALSHIGRDVTIGETCKIQGSVYIADGCIIGDEVFIGPNATLTNDRHPPSGGKWSPVVVEDKVVIGANATIVAGVRLCEGCVIGAGSVVTEEVPSEQVWAGNPAKFLMTLEEYESRRGSNE